MYSHIFANYKEYKLDKETINEYAVKGKEDPWYVEQLFYHYIPRITKYINRFYGVYGLKHTDHDLYAIAYMALDKSVKGFKGYGDFSKYMPAWLRKYLNQYQRKEYFRVLSVPERIQTKINSGELEAPQRVSYEKIQEYYEPFEYLDSDYA
jgi:hypothetical protein